MVLVTHGQTWSKNIQCKIPDKPILIFKLCAILASVVKSHTVLLCPTQDANHLPVSH